MTDDRAENRSVDELREEVTSLARVLESEAKNFARLQRRIEELKARIRELSEVRDQSD